jgi:hypothetical protein
VAALGITLWRNGQPKLKQQRDQRTIGGQHALTVGAVRPRLRREQEAGARDRGGRASRQDPAHVCSVGDSAGGEHGLTVGHLEDARQRVHDAHQVPTRLDALDDQPVGALGQRAACLLHRADGIEHGHAAGTQTR